MPRHVVQGARIVLGLVFLLAGLNGLHVVIPVAEPSPEGLFMPVPEQSAEGRALMEALIESGYVMRIEKAAEIVFGVCLIANVFVPLALIGLTPLVIAIAGFHLVLDPSTAGLVTTGLLVVLQGTLVAAHWRHFRPLLRARPA